MVLLPSRAAYGAEVKGLDQDKKYEAQILLLSSPVVLQTLLMDYHTFFNRAQVWLQNPSQYDALGRH